MGLPDEASAPPGAQPRKTVWGEYVGSDGKLLVPLGVSRVPLCMGVPAVQHKFRSKGSRVLSFNVEVKSEDVRDILRKGGWFDNLENLVKAAKARVQLAHWEGQEHRLAVNAHATYCAALSNAFGTLAGQLAEVHSIKKRCEVFQALWEGLDWLEERRFEEKLPWDAAGGMLIAPAFTAVCATVSAVLERVKSSSFTTLTEVYGKLREAKLLDSESKGPKGVWVRDRQLKPPRNGRGGGQEQDGQSGRFKRPHDGSGEGGRARPNN